MTLDELHEEAENNYWALWDKASAMARDVKLYLHWTAGDHNLTFSDYYVCIKGDGSVEYCLPFSETPEATYCRNTGSIAIALCAARDAWAFSKNNYCLGKFAPTDIQIECLAQVIAVLADALEIPVDLEHVMTHAEAADNLDNLNAHKPYGPAHGCERWDLAVLKQGDEWMRGGDIIRGKAKYYQEHGV